MTQWLQRFPAYRRVKTGLRYESTSVRSQGVSPTEARFCFMASAGLSSTVESLRKLQLLRWYKKFRLTWIFTWFMCRDWEFSQLWCLLFAVSIAACRRLFGSAQKWSPTEAKHIHSHYEHKWVQSAWQDFDMDPFSWVLVIRFVAALAKGQAKMKPCYSTHGGFVEGRVDKCTLTLSAHWWKSDLNNFILITSFYGCNFILVFAEEHFFPTQYFKSVLLGHKNVKLQLPKLVI